MCGISTWITSNYNKNEFIDMNSIISHRGPDGDDFFVDTFNKYRIALGHRRLSIIDLSDKGSQPMSHENLSITFNGEIYNYIEIRDELKKYGYKFESESDTEVLLKAFHKWGENCLEKLNGMFSFVIYDKNKHTLFGARDRYGIKPLYYQLSKDDFKIASEIKQFTVFDNFSSIGNKKIILDFLEKRHFDHSKETMFLNINQIQGGELFILKLDDFSLKIKRWYNILNSVSSEKEKEDFKSLFNKSIKLRLRSDVEIGSCLSGGIDSSSIVSQVERILSQGNNLKLKTFNSRFENVKYDESKFVEILKKEKNIENYYIHPNAEDFFKLLKKIIYHNDEPIWSTSIYSQYKVFEKAKHKNIKVMLDGQGADEVFAGYSGKFYKYYINELIKEKRYKQMILELIFSKYKKTIIKAIIRGYSDGLPSLFEFSILLLQKHLPAILHYEDRNSMAHSIESRVPFLDHKLVEYGINLASEEKIKYGKGKKIIREQLKGLVPDEILERKDKMGFVAPQKEWLINNKENILKKIIKLKKFNLYPNSFYKEIEINFKSNNFDESKIFRLYSLSTWTEVFNIKNIA